MKYIGAHISISQGIETVPELAHLIGAKSFAIFTVNPSRWRSKAISDKAAGLFKENCEKYGFSPKVILPHDSFLINLGSPDASKLKLSREAFIDEMNRCRQLGLTMLNFHPGSHLNEMNEDACLNLIADSVNHALSKTEGVTAVIENTAGQGSNLGYKFEHLAKIIDRVEDKTRIGVCIDTCHAFTSGYDMRDVDNYMKTWGEFERIVGFKYLMGMHLNNTLKAVGSRIDRHSPIAAGHLEKEFWQRLMNDPRMDNIPLILETPNEDIWAEEIRELYSMVKN